MTPKTLTRTLISAGAIAALTVPLSAGMAAAATTADDSSDTDAIDLEYMISEEKLAHDVYVTLGEQYDARQFDNIAAGESQHEAAWLQLLDARGIEDPNAGLGVGEFADPDIQQWYDDLVKQGSTSLADAAAVGIAIEQTDIEELSEALGLTDESDITAVLDKQLAASQRHLSAFERLADGSTGAQAGNGQGRQGGECDGEQGSGNGPGPRRGQGPRG